MMHDDTDDEGHDTWGTLTPQNAAAIFAAQTRECLAQLDAWMDRELPGVSPEIRELAREKVRAVCRQQSELLLWRIASTAPSQ